VRISDPTQAPAYGSVIVGANSTANHRFCILIGSGLTSRHDYDFQIGNERVTLSRTMTEEEFQTLCSLIRPPL
jgi:hypothetical protein